jgi:hypothetical protein
MKLVHIFDLPSAPYEGLWAVQYKEDEPDIFNSLFDNWRDAEWVRGWCKKNISDLQHFFGYPIKPGQAAFHIMREADELEKALLKASLTSTAGENLQYIFKPLDNRHGYITVLQKSKASLPKERSKWRIVLRIYAIRISATTYVVTGGAIKLTHFMDERDCTNDELAPLTRVKDWLNERGVDQPEDLNELT